MTSDLTYPILIGTSRTSPSPIPGRAGSNLERRSMEHSRLEHSRPERHRLERRSEMRSYPRRQRLTPVNPEVPAAPAMDRTVLGG
jgi:hypothetical protein